MNQTCKTSACVYNSAMRQENINQVVLQYRSVTGALDQMFGEMDLRSEVLLWRVNGEGSCKGVSKEQTEGSLIGVAKKKLIKLRDAKSQAIPEINNNARCHYFRQGCCLGDLKSPLCISFIDYPEECLRQFAINPLNLTGDISQILKIILLQDTKAASEFVGQQVTLSDFVELAKDAIYQMTVYVKRFPILEDKDRFYTKKLIEERIEWPTHEVRSNEEYYL